MRAHALAVTACLLAPALASGCVGAVFGPKPPCEKDGWWLHPKEDRCVQEDEFCRIWMSGMADNTVTCTATSTDGRTHLMAALGGLGAAIITVKDADGSVVHEATARYSATIDKTLAGAKGEWTMSADFEDAQGGGEIYLWG